MTFTDDDLTRLRKQFVDGDCCAVKETTIEALLARLGAAELAMRDPDDCGCFEKVCWHVAAVNRWRKAAGK